MYLTISRMASSAEGIDWTMVGGGASGDTEKSSVLALVLGLNSTYRRLVAMTRLCPSHTIPCSVFGN